MSSQMETLSNQFNSLLSQYKETYQEFLNTIDSGENSFTSIPNSAFIGQSNMDTIQGTDIDKCMTECASNEQCSGATFDDILNTCTLSSGQGNIVSANNKSAITKQALYYTYQLQQINNKLMEINTSMMSLANSSMDTYTQNEQLNSEKSEILNQNYQTLEQERVEIGKLVNEYETLNSAIENSHINVTSNYYAYILYLLIAIVLLFMTFKTGMVDGQSGGGVGQSKTPISLFIFLIVVIVFNAYLHT